MFQMKQEIKQGILQINDENLYLQAITTKLDELEYIQKTNKKYYHSNNEELILMGQQLLEFLFFDNLVIKGYPKQDSDLKKVGDLIFLRQKILNESNLAQLAKSKNLDKEIKVGKQNNLRNNQKVLADCYKAVVASFYKDKNHDLNTTRKAIQEDLEFLFRNSGQIQLQDVNKIRYKSRFHQFITQNKNLKHKLSYETIQENEQIQHHYTLTVIDKKFHAKGTFKKVTEELVFQSFDDYITNLQKMNQTKEQIIESLINQNQEQNNKSCDDSSGLLGESDQSDHDAIQQKENSFFEQREEIDDLLSQVQKENQ
ncbi:hypothetical protein pb186bvf_001308 [Paramecium bursaria]